MKTLSRRDRLRLADPVTVTASDMAQNVAGARYDGPIKTVVADMKALLAGRRPRHLKSEEAVRFMALKVEFDGLVIQAAHLSVAVSMSGSTRAPLAARRWTPDAPGRCTTGA